jgi:biotin synthase-like enzyme
LWVFDGSKVATTNHYFFARFLFRVYMVRLQEDRETNRRKAAKQAAGASGNKVFVGCRKTPLGPSNPRKGDHDSF